MKCHLSLFSVILLAKKIPLTAFQPTTTTDYVHDFWSKPRTGLEIEHHVRECLSHSKYKTAENQHLRPSSIQIISAEPPLIVIHDFLSPHMCQEIIKTALSSGTMQPSTVGSQQDASAARTSSTVWINDDECPDALRLLADKVSAMTGLPASHMENLQVVRYHPGQEFQLHTDHQDSFNELPCRGRLATCLIYLAEPETGGETWFPEIHNHESDSISKGVMVAPRQGSAVLFWNTIEKPGCPDYSADMFLNVDNRLLHAGLVAIGEKWICNRWIHPVDFGAGVRGLQ